MTDHEISIILRRLDKQDGTLERLDGKLDAHIAKHKEDMEELKPLARGLDGMKLLGDSGKWILGLILAIAGTITTIKQLWP